MPLHRAKVGDDFGRGGELEAEEVVGMQAVRDEEGSIGLRGHAPNCTTYVTLHVPGRPHHLEGCDLRGVRRLVVRLRL